MPAQYKSRVPVTGSISELMNNFDITPEWDPEYTLNHKYGIHPTEVPSGPVKIRYFGIGIGGTYLANDEGDVIPYTPKQTDGDLYTPIPFRCVPITEDLSANQRQKYRMRVPMTINGQQYVAYYLKRFDVSDISVTQVDPLDDQTEIPYELDPATLSPTPVIPTTTGVQNTVRQEVNVSLDLILKINGREVFEAFNAIYNGDLSKAKVNEIALYRGEDRRLTGYTADNTPFEYTESVYTQMQFKQCCTPIYIQTEQGVYDRKITYGSGNTLAK